MSQSVDIFLIVGPTISESSHDTKHFSYPKWNERVLFQSLFRPVGQSVHSVTAPECLPTALPLPNAHPLASCFQMLAGVSTHLAVNMIDR